MKDFPHAQWNIKTETTLEDNKLITNRSVSIVLKGLPEDNQYNNFTIKIDDNDEIFNESEWEEELLKNLISQVIWREGRLFSSCFIWTSRRQLEEINDYLLDDIYGEIKFYEWLKNKKKQQLNNLQSQVEDIDSSLDQLKFELEQLDEKETEQTTTQATEGLKLGDINIEFGKKE